MVIPSPWIFSHRQSPANRGFRVPIQAGLQAHALSGAHVPAWFCVDVTLEVELVQGGYLPVHIRLVDVPGFVVLKALAFKDRQASKDAYDLWYVLAHTTEGPPGIGRKLLPYARGCRSSAGVGLSA